MTASNEGGGESGIVSNGIGGSQAGSNSGGGLLPSLSDCANEGGARELEVVGNGNGGGGLSS